MQNPPEDRPARVTKSRRKNAAHPGSKYVRPGTEEEWMERCGENYIPVGFGTYAAELGSDSDEANDAKARLRGCMEQRLKPPNRDPSRKPRAQKNPAPPKPRGRPPGRPSWLRNPEPPAREPDLQQPHLGYYMVCCPKCDHAFRWPPGGSGAESETDHDEDTQLALGIIADGF